MFYYTCTYILTSVYTHVSLLYIAMCMNMCVLYSSSHLSLPALSLNIEKSHDFSSFFIILAVYSFIHICTYSLCQ